VECLRRRDREHAGAGAEIEHMTRTALPGQAVEREQATPRGAVMAGAEGGGGFDLDADLVAWNPAAIVRAMHHQAAGACRWQACKTFGRRVARGQRFDR